MGALLGSLAGLGCLLVALRMPTSRRLTLADRIAPYLPGAEVIGRPQRAGALAGAAARLDRIIGGRAAAIRRLSATGDRLSIEQYRTSQVLWACGGAAPGALLLAAGAVLAQPQLSLAGAALVVGGVAGGVIGRDAALSHEITSRNAAMLAELPAVADLLSLAVSAGESPLGALQRVARESGGPLRAELRRVVADTRAGVPLVHALDLCAVRTSVTALARFLDGLVVAVERERRWLICCARRPPTSARPRSAS